MSYLYLYIQFPSFQWKYIYTFATVILTLVLPRWRGVILRELAGRNEEGMAGDLDLAETARCIGKLFSVH